MSNTKLPPLKFRPVSPSAKRYAKIAGVVDKPSPDLGPYDFACEKCGKVQHKTGYRIAQQAQGHTIYFTCDCGHKMEVPE